jgi:hypothetical protein
MDVNVNIYFFSIDNDRTYLLQIKKFEDKWQVSEILGTKMISLKL